MSFQFRNCLWREGMLAAPTRVRVSTPNESDREILSACWRIGSGKIPTGGESIESYDVILWMGIEIRYLLRERRIGPLRVRSGVLGRLLLRVVGVIGPRLGSMWSAVAWAVNILVGVSLWRARPRRVLLVTGAIADAFEARRVSDWRCWRRRRFVSFIERERVTVESKTLAIPVRANKEIRPLMARELNRVWSLVNIYGNVVTNRTRGSNYTRTESE